MIIRTLGTATALALLAGSASAQAIIDNGTIQLGVDEFGQLNVPGGAPSAVDGETVVGLRYLPTGNESTSHGCLCEGWGVGVADAFGAPTDSGSANNDDGIDNLALVSFTSTASTATSVVTMGSLLQVTHTFGPAAETADLYRVKVSIENISGADIADLRYTRTFDWDIEPDTFDEYVTHQGVATTPSVLLAINDGFSDSDPFGSRDAIVVDGVPGIGDFIDLGVDDHGSNFDFGFGALLAGDVFEFDIFYGGSMTEAGALAALGEVGAELYSLGQPERDIDGLGLDGANTFIFGFAGVGGDIIIPDPTPDVPPIPVPAAGWMMLAGLSALGLRRRRRAA